MRLRTDGWYSADEGKIFVLTALGKENCASYHNKEVGKPVSEYDTEAVGWAVDKGYVIEVEDPDWVELPGYQVVYDHNGHQLCAGNPTVFHDREMAEKYCETWNTEYSWHTYYIIDTIYKGKRPIPCREYQGKRVHNWSYWDYDAARVGDLVEEKIAMDLADAVMPRIFSKGIIQTSEPSDSTPEGNTYATFTWYAEGIWKWCGDCLAGKTVPYQRAAPAKAV